MALAHECRDQVLVPLTYRMNEAVPLGVGQEVRERLIGSPVRIQVVLLVEAGQKLAHLRLDVGDGNQRAVLLLLHGPDGRDYPNVVRFLEVVAPERLVYVHGGDEHLAEPVSFRATVTFADRGGSTLVVLRSTFASAEALARVVRDYHADIGAVQHLANLAQYAEGMRA